MDEEKNTYSNKDSKINRRQFLGTSIGTGILFSTNGISAVSANESNSIKRKGEKIISSAEISDTSVDDLVETIATSVFYDQVSNTEYIGESPQISSFSSQMQEFPRQGDSHIVLSSGQASEATKSPADFVSTDVGGRTIPNYSPDNYTANDVAELQIEFTVPDGVKGIALDYQFGSEESPQFLGSEYQDFCELLLFLPDGSVSNIGTLPNGDAVTVDNASEYSNIPSGTSKSPEAPLPDPPDVSYNAVTELLTAERSLGSYDGEEAKLVIRIADASDSIYDSAILFDNLRFVGEVKDPIGPVEQALDDHRNAVIDTIEGAIRAEAETEAELYNEYGSEYADTVVNYYGYLAGFVEKSELDESVLETLNETTAQVQEDRTAAAEEAYNLYSEMFNQAESVGTEERADLFEQYLLGTYPEQESTTTVGDLTLSEIISNYKNEKFASYKSEFLADIEEGEYSDSEVERITSFINSRTRYVEKVLGDTERLTNETIDSITGDGEINGQAFRAEVEKISQQDGTNEISQQADIEPQAVVTGTILAIGSIVLHKIAAAAVAAKGYLALKSAAVGYKITGIAGGVKVAAGSALTSAKSAASYALHSWWSGGIPPVAKGNTAIMANIKFGVTGEITGTILTSMIAEEVAVLEGGPFGLVTWGAEQVVDDIDRDLEDGLGAMPGDCLTYQEREAEITELKVSPINFVDSFKLNIGELDFLYQHDGKLFGKESGEISIKNTSTETFTPNPKFRMQALDTTPAGNDVDVQHPIAVNDPIPQLEPQEEATISFEYAVPLSEKGTSSYKLIAELKNGSGETTQEFDTGYINFDFGETFDLLSGVINPGESSEEKHQPESETENITYELNYDNNDVDLHVTDDQDNHAGMNYKDGTFENEIPGLTHSGNDNGQIGNEYATIQDAQSSEYSVEAIAPDVGTIIQGSSEPMSVSASQSDGGLGSSFDISTTEVSTSELVGEIDVSSTKIRDYKGDAKTSTIVVEELKQSNPLDSVSLKVGELTAQSSSSTIPEDDITIGSTGFDLDAGQLREVDIEVSVPAETAVGTYTTNLQASANDGDTTDTTELVVEIFPEKPDVTIGSGQGPPQDVDQDGLFEDVNGDGEFDISDIQLLFNNLNKEAVQDNPAAFNFSETENPAEVTVSDVQALYDNLMEEQ